MVAALISFPPDPTYELQKRLARRAPLYPLVPKDLTANLDFRQRMLEYGMSNLDNARTLWIACKRDLLFYVNAFCWVQDPRKQDYPALPFITYPFQDGSFLRIEYCIGRCDLWIEKSRDMGYTTMVLTTFKWRTDFYDNQTFLVSSRNFDLVDLTGNTDTLFAKLDYCHKRLPPFLVPNFARTLGHYGNLDTGSGIDGASSTQDLGRGGRRTGTFHDEFASDGKGYDVLSATGDVTRSRFFGSTPKPSGAFTENIQKTTTLKLSLHWRQHPEKVVGLYTSVRGRLKIIDKAFKFPGNYPFILDGRLRSVAYDAECRRRGNNMREMSQEWDINYLGSGFQYFDPMEINRLLSGPEACVRPPRMVGNLEWKSESIEPTKFMPNSGGILHLWCPLDERGNPPSNTRYIGGADIGAGTGASNSSLSILDRRTGEKVAELTSPNLSPQDFAVHVVAVCRWFAGNDGSGVYLNWESNGPGLQFQKKLLAIGYRNVWFDRSDKKIIAKPTDKPGWHSSPDSKTAVIGAYREALTNGRFLNRSIEALKETLAYNYLPDGTVAHSASVTCPDPSGARDNHGDRVIADAVCFMLMGSGNEQQEVEEEKATPEGFSFKSRRDRYERTAAKTGTSWQDRDRIGSYEFQEVA